MNSLFIDPGTIGLGWAVFSNNHYKTAGTLLGPSRLGWEKRTDMICAQLSSLVWQYQKIDEVYIERPFIALKGKAKTSAQKQDVIKLTLIAGRVWQLMRAHYGCPVYWIEVSDWKGQLSKTLTERRVRKVLPSLARDVDDHCIDAIAMGLFKQGSF